MKKFNLFTGIFILFINGLSAQVAINTDGAEPAASSMLDVKSTAKGILLPRMTASQRNAIPSPATGLLVFVSDDNTFYFYSGSAWVPVLSTLKTDNDWTITGNNMYSAVSGNVGIGTTTPGKQLELTQSLMIPATTSNLTGIIFKGDSPFLHDYRGTSALGYNTFLGLDAGNLTSGGGSDYQGSNNTGIGFQALHGVTTGYANTAIGAYSLLLNTSGIENTAVGLQSLYTNAGGLENTAIGYMASHDNTGGSCNVAIGYKAGCQNLTGNDNVSIGVEANFNNTGGHTNTIIGFGAGKATVPHSSSGNVFLGFHSGYNETGSNKLYIENSDSPSPLIGGDFSLNEVYINGKLGVGTSSPAQQLEITKSVRIPPTTSDSTGIIFKGDIPFLHDYRGATALGYNTFLGQNAGNFASGGGQNYQGCNNTGLGYYAIHGVTTGYANTGVGAFCLSASTTGVENSALGLQSLTANTIGSRNTAVGYMSGHENVDGGNNTVIGYNANYYNQGGGSNTIIGYEAGKGTSLHNKTGNIFIGSQAGYNETGSNKLYIENSSSSSPLIGGDFSLNEVYLNGKLGIGTATPSAALHVAGTMRLVDGTQAPGRILKAAADGTASWADPATISDGDWTISGNNMYSAVSGNVGIGTSSPGQQLEITGAMKLPATTSSSTGVIYKGTSAFIHNYHGSVAFDLNTFIGVDAGNFTMGGIQNYQGTNNTGTGYSALHAVIGGYENTANGAYSLQVTTSGYQNTAMGLQSLYSNTSGNTNTGIGAFTMYSNSTGNQNTSLGFQTNYYNQAGSNNTIIGYQAGKGSSVHSKSGNVFLGFQAGMNETGNNKLYIENSNSSTPLIGGDFSTDVAYINGSLGIGTAVPGQQLEITQSMKLPPTSSSTTGVIYKGANPFIHTFNPSGGSGNNTFVGIMSGNFTMGGSDADDGTHNTCLGSYSLPINATGNGNVCVGHSSLYINTSGAHNTTIGSYSMYINQSGNYNTGVGEFVLANNTDGSYNTAVGNQSGPSSSSSSVYAGSFGASSHTTADYQVRIGNSSTTSIGGYVGWTNLSDARFKENIEENVSGLDFILRLRPVTYTLDMEKIARFIGEDKKGKSDHDPRQDNNATLKKGMNEKAKIRYTGFIAQEVEQVSRETGFDFSGVDPPKNEHDFYGLRYSEFVVPLVKAVQEQQELIVKLQKQNEELAKRIETLERK